MAEKKTIIKPLADRVLVEPLSEEDKMTTTKGGIVIPETVDKDRMERGSRGIVVEVGPGKLSKEGKIIPPSVKRGQMVIFSEFSGDKIKVAGKEYFIVSESNVLAVIE